MFCECADEDLAHGTEVIRVTPDATKIHECDEETSQRRLQNFPAAAQQMDEAVKVQVWKFSG